MSDDAPGDRLPAFGEPGPGESPAVRRGRRAFSALAGPVAAWFAPGAGLAVAGGTAGWETAVDAGLAVALALLWSGASPGQDDPSELRWMTGALLLLRGGLGLSFAAFLTVQLLGVKADEIAPGDRVSFFLRTAGPMLAVAFLPSLWAAAAGGGLLWSKSVAAYLGDRFDRRRFGSA